MLSNSPTFYTPVISLITSTDSQGDGDFVGRGWIGCRQEIGKLNLPSKWKINLPSKWKLTANFIPALPTPGPSFQCCCPVHGIAEDADWAVLTPAGRYYFNY